MRSTVAEFSWSAECDNVRSMSNIPLPPAPGSDTHVSLALADSAVSLPGGQSVDEIADPAAATRWLVDHDLVPAETVLLEYCQQRLTGLRRHLREVFSATVRSEEHTSELQSRFDLVCRLLLEKKK